MMTFGTFTMIAAKLMLDTETVGLDGKKEQFSKAIYQSIIMFFAMSFCYPWFQVTQIINLFRKKSPTPSNLSLNSEREHTEEVPAKKSLKKILSVCSFLYFRDSHSCYSSSNIG